MKKGLLLSIVASTVIFAGGDIAPVEPAAAAPAADCSDFYGQVGAYYRTTAADAGDLFDTDASKVDFSVTATIGVEKELFNGIGFGAEVAGWSSLGWDDVNARGSFASKEDGELSQLYVTASFGNTAVKVGRFALPASLSPYAWTDTTAGVKDVTFEGGLVANTDLADTTVYAVYVKNIFNKNTRTALGQDDLGLFALGFVNKSIANTTITATGYYLPDAITADDGIYAGFVTANTKVGDYKLDLQAGAVAGDTGASATFKLNAGDDATFALGAKVSGSFGMVDASLAASYINDGDFKIGPVGGYWLYTANQLDVYVPGAEGASTVAVLAKVSTKVGPGKLWANLGYWAADTATNHAALGARIGYNFKVAGIATTINYRYTNVTEDGAADIETNQVRIEASYKF